MSKETQKFLFHWAEFQTFFQLHRLFYESAKRKEIELNSLDRGESFEDTTKPKHRSCPI